MAVPVIVTGAAGRMGSTVAGLARASADVELVAVLERPGMEGALTGYDCPAGTDVEEIFARCPRAVVVDFTTPSACLAVVEAAVRRGKPVVVGTTGFSPEQEAELAVHAGRTPLFRSPNMSVGVNALFRILPELTRLLGPEYDADIVEIHHNGKKDAPSGTALRLAECLAAARGWKLSETACFHREGLTGGRPKREIGVQAVRGGDVAGVHTVYFMGAGERVEVTHHAHGRENFARGALRAARWLFGAAPGRIYDMQDVL
jgi:4-hydroxy-tetrahydrodipicolinate reductase